MKSIAALALISSLALAGCATGPNGQAGGLGGMGNKQTIGAITGAALGGLAGSNIGDGKGAIAATVAGTLLGAFVGSSIGSSLDRVDMAYMGNAQTSAYEAPIGQTINWSNPQSGNSGSYRPLREGYTNAGSYCREYEQTIVVGGRAETATGTACRKSDGSWEIQR